MLKMDKLGTIDRSGTLNLASYLEVISSPLNMDRWHHDKTNKMII